MNQDDFSTVEDDAGKEKLRLVAEEKRQRYCNMDMCSIKEHICDIIKGNELDVGDISFEILAQKTEFQFPLYYIVFSFDKLCITLKPDIQLQ